MMSVNCTAGTVELPAGNHLQLTGGSSDILNVTEDHMDRYPFGLQQYLQQNCAFTKTRKFAWLMLMMLNNADSRCG